MKGYLIDATKREVREVEYDYSGAKSVARLIGTTDCICIGYAWSTGDVCFVDDSGLLKPQQHFFRLLSRADGQPLPGNGLVTGPDNMNDSDPPVMTIDQIRQEITWLTRDDFLNWARGRGPAVMMHTATESIVLETWDGITEHSKP